MSLVLPAVEFRMFDLLLERLLLLLAGLLSLKLSPLFLNICKSLELFILLDKVFFNLSLLEIERLPSEEFSAFIMAISSCVADARILEVIVFDFIVELKLLR